MISTAHLCYQAQGHAFPENIARKIKCYILKSKLLLREWNAFYFSEIPFTDFTLHKIK